MLPDVYQIFITNKQTVSAWCTHLILHFWLDCNYISFVVLCKVIRLKQFHTIIHQIVEQKFFRQHFYMKHYLSGLAYNSPVMRAIYQHINYQYIQHKWRFIKLLWIQIVTWAGKHYQYRQYILRIKFLIMNDNWRTTVPHLLKGALPVLLVAPYYSPHQTDPCSNMTLQNKLGYTITKDIIFYN